LGSVAEVAESGCDGSSVIVARLPVSLRSHTADSYIWHIVMPN
jgi:hypothetical protein